MSDVATFDDGSAHLHTVTPLGDISGAPVTGESAMLVGRVFRDGTDDTFAYPAYALEIDFHAPFNRLGSPSEYGDNVEV